MNLCNLRNLWIVLKKLVDAHLLAIYYPIQHWKGGDSKIYEF